MEKRAATFIILGGTGDLATKKLIPSIYALFERGELDDFDLVATSRKEMTDQDYVSLIEGNVEKEERWEEFCSNLHFVRLNFYEPGDYARLAKVLRGCGRRKLFYLATLPGHFQAITTNLASHDLVTDSDKVIYEKPFGDDLNSARELNETISRVFPEERIYRIDHYLDKELVENITVLRFANSIVEPIWCSKYIDHVQIIASEDFGVEGRGEFYDRYGAIRDFFQSHILQLLALTTMKKPDEFNAECIRDEKVSALSKVRVLDTITGQYRGYLEEDEVEQGSSTETLAAIKLKLDDPRWRGVPIFTLFGKNLAKKYAQVYVQFKPAAERFLNDRIEPGPNSLVVSIQPDKGIYFTLNTKVPGEMRTTESKMNFCYTCHHGPNTPRAYENLLVQAIGGHQRSFVRSDEIEQQWKIVGGIERQRPFIYEKGQIPGCVRDFIGKRKWHDL
ncbi:glucose-6-phosphate dehydrogenase [Candidatus Bipolaricaulota bacterium]|nr:glucose-6-phosphate dehydrogenase [Candidatus Bipolaricaulota bacterium]